MIAKLGDHGIDHLLAIRWRDRTPSPAHGEEDRQRMPPWQAFDPSGIEHVLHGCGSPGRDGTPPSFASRFRGFKISPVPPTAGQRLARVCTCGPKIICHPDVTRTRRERWHYRVQTACPAAGKLWRGHHPNDFNDDQLGTAPRHRAEPRLSVLSLNISPEHEEPALAPFVDDISHQCGASMEPSERSHGERRSHHVDRK
jgi:hypothetical protein